MNAISPKLYKKILIGIFAVGVLATSGFYMWLKYSSKLTHRATTEGEAPVFLTLFKGPAVQALNRPIGIAALDGKVYVANNNVGRVDVFLPNGQRLRSFYTTPKGTQAQNIGVAIDWVGKIYVSDVSNSSVKVFDEAGDYLHWFPKPLPGMPVDEPFVRPVNLFSADKKLFVADAGDGSVKIFSTTGRLELKLGGNQKGDERLVYPNDVAVLDSGEYVVTDPHNSRVLIFDKKGRSTSQLEQPKGKRPWLLPRGVAVDGFGRIHVVDNFAHQINVYDKNKKFLFSYGDKSDRETNGIQFANGVAVDKELRLIYVTDTGNDRILVWGY